MVAVPEGLQERVGEAEEDQVVHRALPEVVVDPEDPGLVEVGEERPVERQGRGEIVPEGLLDDDPRTLRAAGLRELLHHETEQERRDGQVVRRPPGPAELPAQRLEGHVVRVVPVHVAQQARELLEGRLVEPTVRLQAVAGARLELGEVAGGPEEDQGVRVGVAHRH
jgi:hypothetical protein